MSIHVKKWYETWFNSPYYHILYQNRDYKEAEFFLDNLVEYLKPEEGATMLDVACGKGRHALHLCIKGFEVYGIDLSPQSISEANKIACQNLFFDVHDMREVYKPHYFDFIFNFFTSFGYFEKEEDNYATAAAFSQELKNGGKVILDFMNVHRVLQHLKEEEIVKQSGIEFHIVRMHKNGFINKHITFKDQGQDYHFKEKVQSLVLNDFNKYFESAGMKVMNTFGDYKLNEFDPDHSDRLIMEIQKMR